MQRQDQTADAAHANDARMQRRRFFQAAGGVAMTAASAARVAGANSRLRIALVGCGGRGKSVAAKAAAVEGVEYGYFCDVYDKQAEAAREELAGGVGKLGEGLSPCHGRQGHRCDSRRDTRPLACASRCRGA